MHSAGSHQATGSARQQTVFAWLDAKHQFLEETLARLLEAPDSASASRCLYLAHQLQKACAQQPEALLAALQLNRQARFQQIKELFVAVICELLGKKLGMSPSARLYLICAALTEDIGMLELQNQALDRQSQPLSPQQQRQVARHTENGKRILQRARVTEPLWLTPLEQHHEQPDGRGYPQALKDGAISQAACILRVADSYVAMVRPRGDRPALTPKEAMKEIFMQRGVAFDTAVARTLVNVLGMYPPGTWVQLMNGELGVVSGIGSGQPFPLVSVILGRSGEHKHVALNRDTSQEPYTVVEIVRAPFHFSLTSLLDQIWPKIG